MPTSSTLTSPLGAPVYSPPESEPELFASTTRIGRIVPLVVGTIGAVIIVGGSILYGAGVIGAPMLNESTEVPDTEPRWEPNPEFQKALGVQALRNLEDTERRGQPAAGSLLPPERLPRQPGMTVSPPRDEATTEREIWEPPIEPKSPEGTQDLPKAADPKRTVPNGYADDPRPRNER